MSDLIAFITARLDEDEDAARGVTAGPWHVSAGAEKGYPQSVLNGANILVAQTFTGPEVPPMEADYIARHDPARVLREVAAKRAILALHEETHDCPIATLVGDPEWLYVSSEHVEPGAQPPYWPCTTLRHLAAVWSDHPDYRSEWKP